MATSCDLTPNVGLLRRSCQRIFSRLGAQEHVSRCTITIVITIAMNITILLGYYYFLLLLLY